MIKFYNKDKSLTVYSFNCGYIEHIEKDNVRLELYKDNIYHVRAYNHDKHQRILWNCYDNLTEARKDFYKNIKSIYGTSKPEYLRRVTIKESREVTEC